MKIVNRKDFLLLPDKTLFCKYEPRIFERLSIKDETFYNENDFYVCEILNCCNIEDIKINGEWQEKVIFDPFVTQRDAMNEADALYAVWENEDIIKLIKRLKECIKR